MEPNQKQLLRAAESIRSQLFRLSTMSGEIYLPEEHWNDCQLLARQLHFAETRGWNHCQPTLRDRLERCLLGCLEQLQRVTQELSTRCPKPLPPTLRATYGELIALPAEFNGFSVDLEHGAISVTTERVVLENIDLGPFEIRLHWKRIGERRCYDVVALEPSPAAQSSDVTHPHVRSEQLCEGDGQEAIRRALLSGRLSDFFQIVTQILKTYNGGSAYASLSEWEGSACDDCGQFVSEDDRSFCERCERDLCLDCLDACESCESRLCHSCTDQCQRCQSHLCRTCRNVCDQCEDVCCANCLSENGLCEKCNDETDEANLDEDEDEESTSETAEALAPSTGDTRADPHADSSAV
jgi:hypothetical protein